MRQAIVDFKQKCLLAERRNSSAAVERKEYRLLGLLGPALHLRLLSLNGDLADDLYRGTRDKKTNVRAADGFIHRHTRFNKPPSVREHRNALAAAKDFTAWCTFERLIPKDPFKEVKPVGLPAAGKEKLTPDEANRFMDVACDFIRQGDVGAVGGLLALVVALRATEITSLTPRHIDADCTVVRVIRGKTRKSTRALKIPVDMDVGLLLSQALKSLREGKASDELVFPSERGGQRSRNWPRAQAQRICRAAKVTVVGAHGLRGTHLSMAEEEGTTPEMMLRSAGHTSRGVQSTAYLAPGTTERGVQKRFLKKRAPAMKVVPGGKAEPPAAGQWRTRGVRVSSK